MTGVVREGPESFSSSEGRDGVLLIHGFTGQPYSMQPLANAFVEAHFQVELPLLPGHGTSAEDLDRYGFDDWAGYVDSIYADLARRCSHVVVVGLSMGGTLACWLAQHHSEIAGVILVNPFIGPLTQQDTEALDAELEKGQTTFSSVGSDIKREGGSGQGYEATPIRALLSLIEGATAVRERLSTIDIPMLVFVSRNDHVVSPATSDTIVEQVQGSVERVYFENSFHVVTLDNDAPELAKRAVDFARKVVRD